MTLEARIARSLEDGRGGFVSATAARAWEALSSRSLARPLTFREGARVIAVGGATLGGSGKTPLAIACARLLREHGGRVAFVGHAYRASPRDHRVVVPGDDVKVVGDEALVAARVLETCGVPVVVGPTRQAALDHALTLADVVIVDGVAQLRPTRADLALLAVDEHAPWGAGSCPPAGDLRAPRRALLDACDRVVAIGSLHRECPQVQHPFDRAGVISRGAWLGGKLVPWTALRARRVGLWTSIARPGRVLNHLAQERVTPSLVIAHGDHAPSSPAAVAQAIDRGRREAVDLWLTTAKCAESLPRELGGVEVATLDYDLLLAEPLAAALRRVLTAVSRGL